MGNPDFGCVVPLPYPLILSSFHPLLPHSLYFAPGSTSLHWVHIGLACPFPLPTPWVMACNEAQRLMQLKRTLKTYMATFNRKCTTRCKRWRGQIHLARRQNQIHELYPIIMAITLVPTGSMNLLDHIRTHDCPNPRWAMNRPTFKGGIHYYILYIFLLPFEPRAVNQRKS